jgi:hypothetical protein
MHNFHKYSFINEEYFIKYSKSIIGIDIRLYYSYSYNALLAGILIRWITKGFTSY